MSVIRVTRKFSGRNPAFRAALVDTILFDVTGVTDPFAALSAADAVTGLQPSQMNTLHPDYPDSPLVCAGPAVKEVKGPQWYVIECQFSIPANGIVESLNIPPLLQPPIITWTPSEVCEPVDVDYGMSPGGIAHDPRPIVASNGFPIGPGSRDITMWQLEIIKNAAYFDWRYSEAYGNKVNSSAVTLTGVNPATIQPEHMCCRFFGPAQSFTPRAKYIPLRVVFDVMFDDSLGKYPFQHRFMDQGTMGWYEWPVGSGTKYAAPFYNGEGPVSDPVRLDGTGKPLAIDAYSEIKVGRNKLPPVSRPGDFNKYYAELSNTEPSFIWYSKKGNADLNPLLAKLLA